VKWRGRRLKGRGVVVVSASWGKISNLDKHGSVKTRESGVGLCRKSKLSVGGMNREGERKKCADGVYARGKRKENVRGRREVRPKREGVREVGRRSKKTKEKNKTKPTYKF